MLPKGSRSIADQKNFYRNKAYINHLKTSIVSLITIL